MFPGSSSCMRYPSYFVPPPTNIPQRCRYDTKNRFHKPVSASAVPSPPCPIKRLSALYPAPSKRLLHISLFRSAFFAQLYILFFPHAVSLSYKNPQSRLKDLPATASLVRCLQRNILRNAVLPSVHYGHYSEIPDLQS